MATCGCIDPNFVTELEDYYAQLTPIVWGSLTNVAIVESNQLERIGGTPDTPDAFGYSSEFVEGTGCGLWECRQFFDDVRTNNGIFFVIEDEFGTANRYGWFFQNFVVDSRRSTYHGTTTDFPIYYGPAGGPAPPDQVGYNVGFRFGIYYNNGDVLMYENDQWTNDTNDFFGSDNFSFTGSGLPTDRRWRLKVYVFPAAPGALSPIISEFIAPASDVCGEAVWTIPALDWEAEGEIGEIETQGVSTKVFDEGLGNTWYMVGQISDSGDELRAKTVKALRVTGKLTAASAKIYGYEPTEDVNVDDLEDGTNSETGAVALVDTDRVAQSERWQVNVPNAVLHTIRVEGEWDGVGDPDRIDEVVYEVADHGNRK